MGRGPTAADPGLLKVPGIHFRSVFVDDADRETLRAFLLFGVLVLALFAIIGNLALRDLGLRVLSQRRHIVRVAALEIASEVHRVCGASIDFRVLQRNAEPLRQAIQAQVGTRKYISQVEIRDRFGVGIIRVLGRGLPEAASGGPISSRAVVTVPLAQAGRGPQGEVRIEIASHEAIDEEISQLQRSLWLKVGVAGLAALGVLVAGLFYVLHLIRKNRNLERARQSAERASYVGLLASGLAHEIRNPLNAMNMNLQMLEEELAGMPQRLDPDQCELLDSTKREIKRLEQLVNNFLTYARPAQPRFEERDLNGSVGEVVRLLEADFRQHGVTLVFDAEPLLPSVETDETQLKQALINLLVNARQVLKNGGRVVVRTRAGAAGDVIVEVSDNGPGIPVEARERIFEVFYSNRGGGTGLGLPIAKQIVERHGGTIGVASVVGEGTTFSIRLPRHPVSPIAPAPGVQRTA